MKKLCANIGIFFWVIFLSAVSASADNLWCETPDLENLSAPSFVIEPSRLSVKAPNSGLWEETPARQYHSGKEYGILEKTRVINIRAHPNMYAETPDSPKIVRPIKKVQKVHALSNIPISDVPLSSSNEDK